MLDCTSATFQGVGLVALSKSKRPSFSDHTLYLCSLPITHVPLNLINVQQSMPYVRLPLPRPVCCVMMTLQCEQGSDEGKRATSREVKETLPEIRVNELTSKCPMHTFAPSPQHLHSRKTICEQQCLVDQHPPMYEVLLQP